MKSRLGVCRHYAREPSTAIGCLLGVAGAGFVALGAGCVQRRMTVRTNPPGALLYVDDYEIGTTPVSANFTYYGTRKIRLVKDGYETLTVMQWIPPPWYEFPPMDFVSENFVPGQIRDQRILDFQLKPQAIVPGGELIARAEQLRRGIHAATGSAAAAARSRRPAGRRTRLPAAGRPEVVPAPEGVGGQPVHPLAAAIGRDRGMRRRERQGDGETSRRLRRAIPASPCLPLSLSRPCLLVPDP